MRRLFWFSLFLCMLGGAPLPAGSAEAPRLSRADDTPMLRRTLSHMSTTVTISIAGQPEANADRAVDEASAEIERIEQLMSEWRADSEISQVNAAAGDHPVRIGRELFRLLQAAIKIGDASAGRFDVTFAPLGALWDFRRKVVPGSKAIDEARKRVDYRKLRLDADAQTAFLTRSGMSIGLGGIAKGYAIDRAVQVIRGHGIDDFAVNAGGDLYVSGPANSRRWQVGVRDPRDAQALIAVLPVANVAVATSGDYERYFIQNGQRYSHLIDPSTGVPARLCRSATVVSARAFQADALATALFVLGPDRGFEMLGGFKGVEALVIDADARLHTTRGLGNPGKGGGQER